MPDAERLGARSRCWVAPVGTDPSDKSAWAELPVTEAGVAPAFTVRVDEPSTWPQPAITLPSGGWRRNDLWPDEALDRVDMVALRRRINKAAYDYSMPSRWLMGCEYPKINERSKPVGLTRDHFYQNSGGREALISVERAHDGASTAYVFTGKSKHVGRHDGVYVSAADSIPLALNVLGYDRSDSTPHAAGPIAYNGRTANRAIPTSKGTRDSHIAEAIDLLIGADIYDQREAAKTAESAEREARRKKRVEAKELARQKLRDLTEAVADFGPTPDRADELIAAAKDYKAAVDAVGAVN